MASWEMSEVLHNRCFTFSIIFMESKYMKKIFCKESVDGFYHLLYATIIVVIMYFCTHKANRSFGAIAFRCQRFCNRVYSKARHQSHNKAQLFLVWRIYVKPDVKSGSFQPKNISPRA